MEILNHNLKIKSFQKPYPFWIIDNFLKTEVINEISDIGQSTTIIIGIAVTHISMEKNILEQGMLGISKLEKMPREIAVTLKYLHTSFHKQNCIDSWNGRFNMRRKL